MGWLLYEYCIGLRAAVQLIGIIIKDKHTRMTQCTLCKLHEDGKQNKINLKGRCMQRSNTRRMALKMSF